MQSAITSYSQFQRQAHSQHQILKVEELKNQISNLQQLGRRQYLSPTDKKLLQKYIKIYNVAIKQIQRMKKQFTTPVQFNQRMAEIFDNQIQQITYEKTFEIRSSEIEIPTFKKNTLRENVIQAVQQQKNDLGSPALKNFFERKQAQIKQSRTKSNFKSVLQSQQNKDASRSISKQQSRSSASSFNRRPGHEAQLRRVLEQNKKIKLQYEKKLKRELQLSEFEKKLLKDEKDRYMRKIQELEGELQGLYRANYKLKEQVQIKQKTLKDRSEFGNSDSFRNVDENVNSPLMAQGKEYYQPYVMKTKHNDLKRLNKKCQTQYDPSELNNMSSDISQISSNKKPLNISSNMNQPPQDFLFEQLEKQLKEIDQKYSKSNQSRSSANKKNMNKFVNNGEDDLLSVLKKTDSEEELYENGKNGNNSKKTNKPNGYNDIRPYAPPRTSTNPFQKKPQASSFSREQFFNSFEQKPPPINILPPSMSRKPSQQPLVPKSTTSLQQRAVYNPYQPQPNYSFTKAYNKDYSMTSNPSNYDTFQITKTYLNISQNQDSQTNKYIDSRTSTRNKVAFFKDSLILIKNDTFELAFKRSSLVTTKDRVRIIFFIKNKTNQALTVSFRYEYDASYFKLKVNERIETIPPNSQAREDLQIYGYSTVDLNQVIDVMVDVDFSKYGLWMPVLWIEFQENDRFKMPDQNSEISFIPDRQFRNYEAAQSVMPLMWGGKDSQSQWAYLYGVSKFGPCYVKLTWEESQLKIQTDAKWIDLLAFVMHHVK